MIWRTKYGTVIWLHIISIVHVVDTFTSCTNNHNLQVGHTAKFPSVPMGGDKFIRKQQQIRPVYTPACSTTLQE